MSENLNCSTEGFSKYDSMSIGELEEILRADAQGPERDDSDVDEILYVMEVLAKKRRQNGIAGKTALEAYQEFQHHYLPMVEEEKNIESVLKRKATVIPFRRLAAIAASLILVFTLTTSANAFGWKDIWNAVAKWAEETFSFSMGVEVSEPKAEYDKSYSSLGEALTEIDIDVAIPCWIPDGYTLEDIIIDTTPKKETILAIYQNGNNMIKVSIKSFFIEGPEQLEANSDACEIYTVSGIDYYILTNNEITQAIWLTEKYECYISGDVDIETLKLIIDSIEKG